MESTNLSAKKRKKMLEFLNDLRESNKDDEKVLKAINEIEAELNNKKYGLVWEEHEEEVDRMLKDNIPVFSEVYDKEIKEAEDDGFNFLLEGDNLHSLKLLEKTHKGKVDVIYIDPPYNTGNEDFIYNDEFVGEDDSYRHSKWLSFMEKRLLLSNELLNEKGVIFIQIDDNEIAQLKMLCDEVFGQDNFINVISVNMKNIAGASGGGEDKRLKKNCEYILIYAKRYDKVPVFNSVFEYERISDLIKRYRSENKSWKYTSALIDEGKKEYIGSTQDGEGDEIKIYERKKYVIKSVRQIMLDEGISEDEVYNKYGSLLFTTAMPQSSIRPRVMERVKELKGSSDMYSIEYVPKTGKNKGKKHEQFYKGDKFRLFAWLKDVSVEKNGELYKKNMQGTYWDYVSEINNLTKEGNVRFPSGKKPLKLIKRLIELYPKKEALVLDFFAGSGTTGHAVLNLNKDDGGKRKFILCTNNDNSICEKITYQRINNSIRGYKNVEGIPANLKYYRTDFVSKDEEYLTDDLNEHIREMVQLELGVDIDGSNYCLVLSDDDADELEKKIDEMKELKRIYVSKDVLLTSSQKSKFKDLEKYVIPDCYYDKELKESGE